MGDTQEANTRRSGRGNKGQHTKIDLDNLSPPPKKKVTKKGGKKAAKQEEEGEEVVRCVCGASSTDGDTADVAYISCDTCQVWQHNVCVNISPFADDIPDTYLCEQHDPVFHKELLAAMSAGKPIWLDRQKHWKKVLKEMSEGGPSKKGEKAAAAKKGSRKSKANEHANGNGTRNSNPPSTVSTPAPEVKKETPTKLSNSKRKDRHEPVEDDAVKEPQTKVRKVTAPPQPPRAIQEKTPPTGLPVTLNDLDSSQLTGAKAIFNGLKVTLPIALKEGIFSLVGDDTVEKKAERLSIRIEDAVHKTHADKSAYTKQCRAIFSNLKTNQELTTNLLSGVLTPSSLAAMSTDDMASTELKRRNDEMKAQSLKQAILVTDDNAPRIRRTHKGDEVIEDDDNVDAHDSTITSVSRRRSMLDPNGEMATRSRENSPGNEVELPENSINDHHSHDIIRRHPLPISVDTTNIQTRKASSGGTNFDIDKVYSSVQSPTAPSSHIRRPSGPPSAVTHDPDIDRLLKEDDDETPESPPYSPQETVLDPDVVWHGNMIMDSIAKFSGQAKHVAGAEITKTSSLTWAEVIEKDLRIAGRIDQVKANDYLCGLRYSPPTDVVVVLVTPQGAANEEGFKVMFDYFHDKARYGVLTNKRVNNIRDTYLVPIPKGGPLPDFIKNLEGHKLDSEPAENIFVVALVIRNEMVFPRDMSMQSPSAMAHPQFPPANSASPVNASYVPPSQSEQEIQARGVEAGKRILGPYADAPTVQFLLPQAWQMRPLEWEVIRDILDRDPPSRTDLNYLSTVLEKRMRESSS